MNFDLRSLTPIIRKIPPLVFGKSSFLLCLLLSVEVSSSFSYGPGFDLQEKGWLDGPFLFPGVDLGLGRIKFPSWKKRIVILSQILRNSTSPGLRAPNADSPRTMTYP